MWLEFALQLDCFKLEGSPLIGRRDPIVAKNRLLGS